MYLNYIQSPGPSTRLRKEGPEKVRLKNIIAILHNLKLIYAKRAHNQLVNKGRISDISIKNILSTRLSRNPPPPEDGPANAANTI